MVLHIFFSVFIVETMNILPKEDIEKITNSFSVGLNLSFVKFINFEQFMIVMPLNLMVRRIIRTMKKKRNTLSLNRAFPVITL